ncbi:hypothetical protein C5746_02500 [Streptomyces atratus]|uniref:Uncharacterized protein n=1 Tax=Streptomyces atratus TaxID=1893 RepID=A0A2Z5J754_STRAR|nr:hypothetical protein C5746_02500 [Streptomyces atratus]
MKLRGTAVVISALVAGGLLSGTAQASTADTPADMKPLTWVGQSVSSESAPAGKVAHYQADPEKGTIKFLGFVDPEPEITTTIVQHNPPQSGDCVLSPWSTPYAAYGFRGAGTMNGTWSNRKRITGGTERCAGTFHAQSGGPSFNTNILANGAYVDFTSPAVVTQVRI